MATRLQNLVIDSAAPHDLAEWWGTALAWPATHAPDESYIEVPAGNPGIDIVFVPVDDDRVIKNRIHLDLASKDADQHLATVERLLVAGARRIDIGQGDVPWLVMADPEGNEFCVLEPRSSYHDTGPIAAIVVDCMDPELMAPFWELASGWTAQTHDQNAIGLRAPEGGPWLEFMRTGEPHTIKNRVHLDVAPFSADDQAEEVERLLRAGAFRTEVGQSEMNPAKLTWVVLTDPEENEFCVLSPR